MNTSTQSRSTASSTSDQARPTVAPAVDIFENDDEFLLVADLPGVAQDAVDLQLHQGQLTLSARRGPPPQGEALGAERRLSDFRRVVQVPDDVDATRVDAQLREGVLEIHLPKAEAVKPRRIAISTG